MTTLVIPDIIGWAAMIGAVAAIFGYIVKLVKRIEKPEELQKQIAELQAEQSAIKAEQRLLMNGVLACLKGLKEQGCNGPVTEAINSLEEYLNETAHK